SANTLLSGAPGLTVSAWVNQSSFPAGGNVIAAQGSLDAIANYVFMLRIDSATTFKWAVSDGTTQLQFVPTVTAMNTNTWYHVVATWNGTIQAIYINGVLAASTSSGVPTSLNTASKQIFIGTEGRLQSFFNGSIDEVKLYNYALSPDEVKVDYNQGKAMVLGSLSTNP